MNHATQKLHVPLSPELHTQLRAAAKESGRPATELAREAIAQLLKQRRREKLEAELRAFVEAAAGSELDYDPELAALGHEVITGAPSGFEAVAKTVRSTSGRRATR